MSRSLGAALQRLLLANGDVPSSQFSAAQRQALDELARRTSALRLLNQGRGSVYQVLQRGLLESHLQQLLPHWREALPVDLPERAGNLARLRGSKTGEHGHGQHYLLLKALDKQVYWQSGAQAPVSLSQLQAATGVAALAIQCEDHWYSEQPLWLVENQALFDDLRWLPDVASGSLHYYAGQLHGRLLDWLAARPRAPQVVLCADCDGVGLLNYARLRQRLGCVATFWLADNWQQLLGRYGSAGLWRDTRKHYNEALARLQDLDPEPQVLQLCQAMAEQGLALEQEAWFLQGLKGGD